MDNIERHDLIYVFLAPDSDTTCLAPKAPEKHSHLNVAVEKERGQKHYVYAPAFGNGVQVVQYLYNLPESTSNEVLADLYTFYSQLSSEQVDQALIKYVHDRDRNIMTKLEEIARKHGAVSSLEISLDRARAKVELEKAGK